jgi:hypothetical protein
MTSILDQYWNEMRGKFSRLPVWLPGTSMDLGDVGVLREQGWEKATDLGSIGISFSRDSSAAMTTYSYSSAGGAEITTRLAAQAGPAVTGIAEGNAALNIRFRRPAAFVLMADDVEVRRIGNLQLVDRAVLEAYQDHGWESEWVYVSEVAIGAPALTVVAASAEGEATVDLGIAPQVGGTGLGRAHAELGFGHRKDLAASFVTTERSALMWRGHYVRDPLFRKASIEERGPDETPGGAPSVPTTAWVGEIRYLSDALSGG